jgi:hypothetical protein
VNLPTHFASMSVDELWEIHEEISKLLKVKMLAETKTLERRLITLRPAEVDRRSIRARWELQNDRVIARAQLQAKQGDDQIKMQVQNQKLIEAHGSLSRPIGLRIFGGRGGTTSRRRRCLLSRSPCVTEGSPTLQLQQPPPLGLLSFKTSPRFCGPLAPRLESLGASRCAPG